MRCRSRQQKRTCATCREDLRHRTVVMGAPKYRDRGSRPAMRGAPPNAGGHRPFLCPSAFRLRQGFVIFAGK